MIVRVHPEGDLLEIDIESCRRCNGHHVSLLAKPFERFTPMATHWVLCPTTREPILVNPTGRTA